MVSNIEMASNNLSPFVYWGQTRNTLSLKVDLRNVENVEVTLTEDSLTFAADGLGVKGLHKYDFHVEFYLAVDPEKSRYRKTDLAVEFQIEKSASESWPRLTAEKIKLPWLKIDFDKFMLDESETSDTENKNQEEVINKIVTEIREPPKGMGPSLKKCYLLFYNLFQFIGFAYIFVALIARYIKYGESAKQAAFETAGQQLMVCQVVAVLEVLNAVFGLVKSNVLSAVMQLAGRNFVLFALILQETKLQISSVCWYLFIVWSAIEIVRYPFYFFQLLGVKLRFLSWLRYSIWIPLYPLGILIESCIVVLSITYFAETGFFSFQLPNQANFAFYFPYFLMFYLVLASFGGTSNLNYMRIQRKKQLGDASAVNDLRKKA